MTLRPLRALNLDANIASKTPERYKDVKCVVLGAEVIAELKLGTTDANCDCVFVKNALVSTHPQIWEARPPPLMTPHSHSLLTVHDENVNRSTASGMNGAHGGGAAGGGRPQVGSSSQF